MADGALALSLARSLALMTTTARVWVVHIIQCSYTTQKQNAEQRKRDRERERERLFCHVSSPIIGHR